MGFIDELDYGDEIRGVICPKCGGSLVWRNSKAFCYEDGVVTPEKEHIGQRRMSKEDRQWLEDHSHELEPEIE